MLASPRLPPLQDRAYQLYKEHGTCLKGLLVERILDEAGAEEFLTEVPSSGEIGGGVRERWGGDRETWGDTGRLPSLHKGAQD